MAYNRKTKLYEGYIYEIYNNVNDVKYIGQTRRTIALRYGNHKKDYVNKVCNLYEAMRNIGFDHFNVRQIEKLICNSLEELIDILNEREIYWIKYYKDNDISLYNMTEGGDNAPNKFLERPVIQYDLFCNKVECFSSAAEASEKTGVSRGDISSCCLKVGKIYSAGNYIWRYKEEPLTKEEIEFLNKKYKGICQYDFDGNLINTFYTIKDAKIYLKREFGLKGSNIFNCAVGKSTSSDGFIWRYRKDSFDKYHIPKQIKKVEQRDINTGKLINTYDDCVKASLATGCNKNGINCCCNGRNKYCGGYIWCFENEYKPIKIKQKEKSVNRYDLNNNLIDSYNSISEASRALNINRNLIGEACNNKIKQAGGYIWRFNVNNKY